MGKVVGIDLTSIDEKDIWLPKIVHRVHIPPIRRPAFGLGCHDLTWIRPQNQDLHLLTHSTSIHLTSKEVDPFLLDPL